MSVTAFNRKRREAEKAKREQPKQPPVVVEAEKPKPSKRAK